MTAATTELRGAVIAHLKADATVAALVGDRIVNYALDRGQQNLAFPYMVIQTSAAPWDFSDSGHASDRGADITLNLYVLGEYPGQKQGEDILNACLLALRDWDPPDFSAHRLVNLVCGMSDVQPERGSERNAYNGIQRWQAKTEEL